MSSSAVPMEPTTVPYERFNLPAADLGAVPAPDLDAVPAPDLDAVPAYKWWAVFNIVCCCLPLGIVAVYFAGEVEERLARRDIEGAKSASRTARMFNIMCMLFGAAAYCYLIYYCVQIRRTRSSSLPPFFG